MAIKGRKGGDVMATALSAEQEKKGFYGAWNSHYLWTFPELRELCSKIGAGIYLYRLSPAKYHCMEFWEGNVS